MAGIVLVQKFIQPGGKAYKGYVDYMDRPEAIGSRSDLSDYDTFGTYQEYMGNPEKSTGLFNNGDYISSEEKNQIKEIFNQSGKQGGILYQTVISFEPKWLQENGIMDDHEYIHEELLREYTRIAVNTIQEKENMKSFVWTAAVHYNTAHPHIHIAMVDPKPSWIPGHGRCRVNSEGDLYQRGKWRESTMEAAKSRIVNKVLDMSGTNKKLNEITRSRIIQLSKNRFFHREYDLQIENAFSNLIESLPEDMRLWKYGNNAMKSFRSQIDQISDMVMKKYCGEELKELDHVLDTVAKQYAVAYGESERGMDFKKKKKDDLRYRMGNAILVECREITRKTRNKKAQQGIRTSKVNSRINVMYKNRYAVSRAMNSLRQLAYKNIQSMKNQAAYERMYGEDLDRNF